jgi:hypothetical protein
MLRRINPGGAENAIKSGNRTEIAAFVFLAIFQPHKASAPGAQRIQHPSGK